MTSSCTGPGLSKVSEQDKYLLYDLEIFKNLFALLLGFSFTGLLFKDSFTICQACPKTIRAKIPIDMFFLQ